MRTLRQSSRPTAHDHLVRSLGDLYRYYEEMNNTSGRLWVCHSAEVIGISNDDNRYLSTGLSTSEEFFNTARYHAEVDAEDYS